jgi:hypothetical protein
MHDLKSITRNIHLGLGSPDYPSLSNKLGQNLVALSISEHMVIFVAQEFGSSSAG